MKGGKKLAIAAAAAAAAASTTTTTTTDTSTTTSGSGTGSTTTTTTTPPPPTSTTTVTIPAGYTVVPSTTACDGSTDVTAKLQAEVNALSPYQALQLQAGTCVTSNNINVVGKNHIIIYGAGADATIIKALTPDKSAIIVTQSDTIMLAAMQVQSPNATSRLQVGNSDGFYLFNGSNYTVDGVKAYKVAGAGVYFSDVSNGVIQNSECDGSLADCFHVTGGSRDITIQRNISRNNGDDAFASIGYQSSGQNYNISILDNQAYDGWWAGGIGIEGTVGAKVYRNKIYRSGIAGIRIDSQTNGGYYTAASDQIDLQDNYLEGCVTRTNTGHGSIMMYANYFNVHGVTGARNQIVNPTSGPGVRAYGTSSTQDIQASFSDTQMSGVSTPFTIGSYASINRISTTCNGNPC